MRSTQGDGSNQDVGDTSHVRWFVLQGRQIKLARLADPDSLGNECQLTWMSELICQLTWMSELICGK